MEHSKTKVIVGAGLVGSLLAIVLAKKGFKVDIYESRPDMRTTKIPGGRSINLSLSFRGIQALKSVGLMDEVSKIMIPMFGREIHETSGTAKFQPYGLSKTDVHYSISRKDLNCLLLNAAENTKNVSMHFNHCLKSVDLDNNNLTFKKQHATNGLTKVKFEQLFGTDGYGSIVREAILAEGATQNSNQPLGHGYKELLLPALPNQQFAISKEVLHIWPRDNFMLIGLPNLDGSFTMTLFLSLNGPISFEHLTTEQQASQFFSKYFPDIPALIPDYQQQIISNPLGNLATVRCFPWHFQDKALILGDAAHAIVPFHGQGMNCGFEDCQLLHESINTTDINWQNLFESFEQQRKANADSIAEMAIENYIEMRHLVHNPNFLLKKGIAFKLHNHYGDKFIPRYNQVMFYGTPYKKVKDLGDKQDKILTYCCQNLSSIEQFEPESIRPMIQELVE